MGGKKYSLSFNLDAALSSKFLKSFQSAGCYLSELSQKVNKYNLQAAKIDKVIRYRKSIEELTKDYTKQKTALNKISTYLILCRGLMRGYICLIKKDLIWPKSR